MQKFRIALKSLTKYQVVLLLLFALSLPLVNPWVRGDGVGYYAYVHALLIRGDLHFDQEWLAANETFRMNQVDSQGHLLPDKYSSTGYVKNHFAVGPSMLWAPFLVVVHLAVLSLDKLGLNIPANGYSWPYTDTMALATASFGFIGLYLSFKIARHYFDERVAFWATVGIWLASSLPVYMYLNPSWSHAHSAFVVALFLWYWHRTRGERTTRQWLVLGAISGLMLDVYYPNGVFMLIPLLESVKRYWRSWKTRPTEWAGLRKLFGRNLLYVTATLVAFLPTLITRKIIYGSALCFGYGTFHDWNWMKPALWPVLFSSDHGLLSWTPILIPALVGLIWLGRRDAELALYLGASVIVFYYVIASYWDWDGISSFGNRFFISLTPLFVLGLSAFIAVLEKYLRRAPARMVVPAVMGVLIVWNLGFIFQWGTKMIPNRGPISWEEMAENQVTAVPEKILRTGELYLLRRGDLMHHLEREDALTLKRVKSTRQNGKQ